MSKAGPEPTPRHLVLVGGMAVGKTSVGRKLAEHLTRRFLDSDDHLLATRGQTGRQLAARDGVEALHRAEARHLLDTLASDEPAVVAAAASVVDEDRCLDALRSVDVVWLRAQPETAALRMAQGGHHRRSLGPDRTEAIASLADRRAARYGEVADLVIDTDQLRTDDIASQVLAWLTIRHG